MLFFPIALVAISVFMCIAIGIKSVQKGRFLSFQMALSILATLVSLAALGLYKSTILGNDVYEKGLLYYGLTLSFLFFILLISMMYQSVYTTRQYQLFIHSLKDSKWNVFYVTDQKDRIKEFSDAFIEELGLEKKKVQGKQLFTIFNKTIRFISLNQHEITNNELEDIYKLHQTTLKEKDIVRQELAFLNFEGNEIFLNVTIQPIYFLGKYKGRLVVGEKRSNFDLLEVEKALQDSDKALDSVRNKLIATLEITQEGLYAIDLNERTIWASDSLVKMMRLPKNTMELSDFRRFIEPQDLQKQQGKWLELTPDNDQYTLNMRIYVGGEYVWFKERAKHIFSDHTMMGTLNPLTAKAHHSTGLDSIDQIKEPIEFLHHIDKLLQSGKYFHMILIKLKNIPDINQKQGRTLGSLMMAEYLKYIKQTFLTETSELFRMDGLEFVFTLTDPRKIALLKQHMELQKNFLNMKQVFGSIELELDVYMGAVVSTDKTSAKALYEAARQALQIAENVNYSGNACYYKDILV